MYPRAGTVNLGPPTPVCAMVTHNEQPLPASETGNVSHMKAARCQRGFRLRREDSYLTLHMQGAQSSRSQFRCQ